MFDYSIDGINEVNIDEYISMLTDTTTQEWRAFEKNLPIYETHLRTFIEPRLVEKGEGPIVLETHETQRSFGETIIHDGIHYETSFSVKEYYDFYEVLVREAKTASQLFLIANILLGSGIIYNLFIVSDVLSWAMPLRWYVQNTVQ